jgi:rSAM/selenodomain-associated transferase 1
MTPEKLIVFVKAPRIGTVKTRLAESIGAAAACAAYQQLVAVLLQRLRSLPGVQLRFTPDDAADEIRSWLKRDWTCQRQGPGVLGHRLHMAFAESFKRGAQTVVIIGSDCPSITPEDVHVAGTALLAHDIVVGPARDGGYWLIGLRRPQPELFEGISWGTDRVFADTVDRARDAGLSVKVLHELEDVDTEEEWRRFLARQSGDVSSG